MTNYEILGWSDHNGACEIQVTSDYGSAKAWVVDFVRNGGMYKHEEILIQNDEGEPMSAYDKYGWTHY